MLQDRQANAGPASPAETCSTFKELLDALDTNRLQRLMERAQRFTYALATPDPDELLHSVLLKLLDRDVGPDSPECLEPYLRQVLRHESYDQARRARARSAVVKTDSELVEVAAQTEPEPMETRYDKNEVQIAISQLDSQLRAVVNLQMQGLTFRQIGKELGISDSAAGRRFRKALAEMRRFLTS